MAEPDFDFYFDVLGNLGRLDVPYVVIGAFAGTFYGVTRTTFDVDIVVRLEDAHIAALAGCYPLPRFDADPVQMRNAIREGSLFNIIDTTQGRKVDLIPLSMKPGYAWALRGKVRRTARMSGGGDTQIWIARPQDVIIGKLMAWKEGRSFKHEQDIRDILTAVRLGDDADLTEIFDFAIVDEWAARLGTDVQWLWVSLQKLAQEE